MSRAGATGFEPAVFGLTGRHVYRYTTPPEQRHYTTACAPSQIRPASWSIVHRPLTLICQAPALVHTSSVLL